MRKVFWMVWLLAAAFLVAPEAGLAYEFGDYRSTTLATKAWGALDKGDIEAVLAYTNKCLELYGEQAKKMQAGLSAYPTGKNEEIFAYWALNDAATCLFIQAEAYRKAKMLDEAKEAYRKVISDFTFGQCWDTKGWFWKPAEAAKEKLAAIESGSDMDFGDNTSQTLTTKAWDASNKGDTASAIAYADKCITLYGAKAKEMQASMTEYAWGENKEKEKENVFKNWALNDVGTCLFIKGEALRKAGKAAEAKEAYNKLIAEYFYAQCWDTQGWFWKPVEGAKRSLAEMESAQ